MKTTKRQKKTIIKKKPTVDKLAEQTKRRGRPKKIKEEIIETKKETLENQKENFENVEKELDKLLNPIITEDNITKFADLLNRRLIESNSEQVKIKKVIEEMQKKQSALEEKQLTLEEQLASANKKLEIANEKVRIANTKYRSKYMQLEHERRQWQINKNQLADQISALKMIIVELAPDGDLISTIDRIANICNPNHVATKRSLKIQEIED